MGLLKRKLCFHKDPEGVQHVSGESNFFHGGGGGGSKSLFL